MEPLEKVENVILKDSSKLFVYYKFRLTLDDDVWDGSSSRVVSMGALREWTDWLADGGYVSGRMTAGWEVKNSHGDFCKPHIHIHFKSTSKKDTIVKSLKRHYLAMYDETLVGNGLYSFKLCAFPESEDKFFRYPLKQQTFTLKGKHYCRGFTDEEIKTMSAVAHGSWVTSAECNNSKKDKRENTDTLYDRLLKNVTKKLDGKPLDSSHFYLIVQFYKDEKRPINDSTMVGYYHLIRLELGSTTVAEYSAKLISKYSL